MKCKICKTKFVPKYFLQKTCFNPSCIKSYNHIIQVKKWNEKKKKIKESLKTKKDHIKELQVLVNRYVRLRDKNKPCISCGKPLKAKYDAGHYRSTQAAPNLRFNTLNIFAQCVCCNRELSGNLIEYRKGLINRIGVELVEKIENNNNPKRYTIDELERLKIIFKKKVKKYL